MENVSSVIFRVNSDVKKQAEAILDKLGLSMTSACGIFLRQLIIQNGMPFQMTLQRTAPLSYEALTKEQFASEMEKGLADIREGRTFSADEVDAEVRRIIEA